MDHLKQAKAWRFFFLQPDFNDGQCRQERGQRRQKWRRSSRQKRRRNDATAGSGNRSQDLLQTSGKVVL